MGDRRDLSLLSIAEASAAIRDGRLSPTALVDHCLRRIHAFNPTLNAFITVTPERAREQAHEAEREIHSGQWRGPLHGVPVAVKDFYDTAGIRTTAGFEQFRNRVPSRDAEMVVELRNAGAVLVGKTNMHKLGMGTTSLDSDFGPVVNPWSARHVAGGSSGGSAVAVAAGLCLATVDTDAIGSGRLPAAICGVTCLKPTFDVLSSTGILSGEQADPAILLLGHPCVTARSADDVTIAFHALTGAAQGDARLTRPPAVRRIGVVTNFAASPEVRAAFETARDRFVTMGLALSVIRAPFEKASFDIAAIDRDRGTINEQLFADIDVLTLPTLAAPSPTVVEARARGDLAVAPDNTFFCNYYGLPAISVPSGVDANGLPLGLQFVGPQGGDDDVLWIARAYQQAMGWRFTPPQGFPSLE